MSNFKFLLSEPGMAAFAEVTMAVERAESAIQQSLDKLETLKKL